jgi:hypothetical protein
MALSRAAASRRAKLAAVERCVKTGERQPDDPEVVEAHQEFKAQKLADHVAEVVAGWPPLTPEQLDRIAALLRTGAA